MTDTIKLEVDNKPLLRLMKLAEKAQDRRKILRLAGKTILEYIDEAFDTEGKSILGKKWDDWSDYYAEVRAKINKGEGKILTLDGELHSSIKRRVKGGDTVEVGTNKAYAAIHNFGFDGKTKNGKDLKMPARTYMTFTDKLISSLITDITAELYSDFVVNDNKEGIEDLKKLKMI